MAERKQLLDNLKTTPVESEVQQAFIRTGNAKSKEAPTAPVAPELKASESSAQSKRNISVKYTEPARPSLRQPLTPVTVRMEPEMADALKRLSLERQLENQPLATQRDIVTEALRPILRREGVL